MNWNLFDALRCDASPLEVDLVEAYAQGRIGRRDFLKRGTILGLSVPVMGAVLAACGDDDDAASTETDDDSSPSSAPEAAAGGSLIVAIQQGDANTGLDPVNMLDLGTYNVVSQSFEYLVGVDDAGAIGATGLAESWAPNDDASVWTFQLREGVKWQDGADFTSADVAATMDRLAAQGNAGLKGVIGEGSVDATDPLVAVFTLEGPNSNFPALVSTYNAQALITPSDYDDGTTLDARPTGTGAWMLEDFNAGTFQATFKRNPDWWGGETPLDEIVLRGFEDLGTAVTSIQERSVDVIQQFQPIGGSSLLDDSSFTVLKPPANTHRQIWFHTEKGQFTDKLVRQAMAYTFDRQQMIDTLFNGEARIGNDHPVSSDLPFFDDDAVEQRGRDIEKAKQLLSDAGVDKISATINVGDIQEVPDLAAIIKQNAADAGFDIDVRVQANSTFYGDSWCPGGTDEQPCADADEFGIVDYGHRPVPDIFFSSALASGGVWNSSNYANPEFDQLLDDYRSSPDVDGQKTAVSKMQKILWEDVPASYPYFYNYLSGHTDAATGVQATALGHTILTKAARTA